MRHMELKEFIKKSLIDIRAGVREGNDKLKDDFGGESPFSLGEMKSKIEFDIAVTSEENTKGKVDGTIKVVIAKLGSDLESHTKLGNISRIKFSIYTNFNFLS